MKKLSWFVISAVGFLFAYSCKPIESLSPIPRIEYRSFEVFDTTDPLGNKAKGGRLKFYFEDGNGDVGMDPSEDRPDTNNLVLTLYRKSGGVMVPALPNDALWPSPYRIPYMESIGQNKLLKGTIDVTLLYLFYKPTDTIMYEFYIKDRDNNYSNTASTSEIILSTNKVY